MPGHISVKMGYDIGVQANYCRFHTHFWKATPKIQAEIVHENVRSTLTHNPWNRKKVNWAIVMKTCMAAWNECSVTEIYSSGMHRCPVWLRKEGLRAASTPGPSLIYLRKNKNCRTLLLQNLEGPKFSLKPRARRLPSNTGPGCFPQTPGPEASLKNSLFKFFFCIKPWGS